MKLLYVGDIMGDPGIEVLKETLPQLKKEYSIDVVIAQAENVSDGVGMTARDMKRLQKMGVDFFTGGNHTPGRKTLWPLLEDQTQPVIGPTNMVDCPGRGWKYMQTAQGPVLIISLLGSKVGKQYKTDNPLKTIDTILEENQGKKRVATIVNFHGDYSSEKRIIGYYLDGRVSAVIGDHWHVPTADALILPKGTAHITDVGMCGTLHSSLGVKLDILIDRWRDNANNKNALETTGSLQFNAVLIEINTKSLATSIKPIQKIIE